MSPKTCGYVCVLVAFVLLSGCGSSHPPITVSVSPSPAFVGSAQTIQFSVTVNGDASGVTWTASSGTIDSGGNFTAPAVTQNATATITATSNRDKTKSGSATVDIVAPGSVTSTNEPQVALYTITPPADAKVSIQFGTDTSYGLNTWTQATPAGGGAVSIYVAGMRASTQYHMRAVLQFSNASVNDADHTFTTGAFPAAQLPAITASTTAGMTPQSGVELLSMTTSLTTPVTLAEVADLSGNPLWGYVPPSGNQVVDPIKLLPDDDFLINTNASGSDGKNSVLQEVDLGGNVVWQMTAADLNNALAAATCAGCNITVLGTHHDFAVLPNGHLIVIAATQQAISGTTVTGDVLIDLDQNRKPVWLWNEFDHLDANRHPMQWPDWTHTNAVIYSPEDGDLIVSMRHQHWVIKIDYHDGAGTGNILWKLGYQGDLTLQNGTDPVDWQYAQHGISLPGTNSSGVFQLMLFDNGNNRVLDTAGDICGTTGQPACWSRVAIYQIDETAKTATLQWVDNLSPAFDVFGGNAELLANGDIEFDECSPTFPTPNAAIYEITKASSPQTVWQMQVSGQYAYRGIRIPSLYPGVQW